MSDPAEIARRLTKEQRESILAAQDMMFSRHGYPVFAVGVTDDPWPQGVTNFLTIKRDTLTPLGLAVRAELEKMP